MSKSGVEYLAQHPGWKSKPRKRKPAKGALSPIRRNMPDIKHGVFVKCGVTEFQLSAAELQLIADALEIVNPDSDKMKRKADQLAASFSALSEYAASVK